MKKTLLLTIACITITAVKAQNNHNHDEHKVVEQKSGPEVLSLKETIHDFGMIPQGKPVYYFFEIKNIGNTPLQMENVQAACGCTTPEWSKDAIPVGGTAKIKVGFNAATEGPFEKPITLVYNGNQTKQIFIKGTVWKAPAGSAPANAPVQFLKQQIQ